jgi:hypothetical protein
MLINRRGRWRSMKPFVWPHYLEGPHYIEGRDVLDAEGVTAVDVNDEAGRTR